MRGEQSGTKGVPREDHVLANLGPHGSIKPHDSRGLPQEAVDELEWQALHHLEHEPPLHEPEWQAHAGEGDITRATIART